MLADRIRADMRVIRLTGGAAPFQKVKAVVIISNDGMFADEFAGLRSLIGPPRAAADARPIPYLVHMHGESATIKAVLRESPAIDVRLLFEGVKTLARTNRPTSETWCPAAAAWYDALKEHLKSTPNAAVRVDALKDRFPRPSGVTASFETVIQGFRDDRES